MSAFTLNSDLRSKVPEDALLRARYDVHYTYGYVFGAVYMFEAMDSIGHYVRREGVLQRKNPLYGYAASETQEWIDVPGTEQFIEKHTHSVNTTDPERFLRHPVQPVQPSGPEVPALTKDFV